ncbi:MAG: glycosyltransferase family 2 protein [Actinomycetales bacterium]|nr:glycosyltransferase family 2 protein [Actinomycetales bacterium]
MPHALSRVSLLFGSVPELDVLYADEFTYVGEFAYDHACVPNAPAGYLPKPAWSPLLAQRVPYLGHFVAFRRQILDLPKSHDSVGTAGLDALIRAASSSRGIGHLTEPLSARPVDSPQVIRSVRREEAPVVTGRQPQRADRTISVVVPTKDHAADLERCLRSVRSGTQGLPVEVIVVDHESTEPATARVIADFADKVIRQEGDFNFSRLVNAGVARADGQLVVLLNNDTEGLSEAWLDQLASPFASSRVGAVGALLLEVDDCIQHTGIAVGGSGLTTHPYRGAPRELDDPPGLARDIREVTAATGACLAVRRDVYLDLGGMDEEYLVHYQDVDLCLRIWDARLSVVVNPACVLRHKESSSLHQADWTTISAHSRRDRTRFRERWASLVAHDDLFLRGAGAG